MASRLNRTLGERIPNDDRGRHPGSITAKKVGSRCPCRDRHRRPTGHSREDVYQCLRKADFLPHCPLSRALRERRADGGEALREGHTEVAAFLSRRERPRPGALKNGLAWPKAEGPLALQSQGRGDQCHRLLYRLLPAAQLPPLPRGGNAGHRPGPGDGFPAWRFAALPVALPLCSPGKAIGFYAAPESFSR